MSAAYAVFSSACVYAQLPPRLERCLPYPTLAQEIKELQGAAEEIPKSGSSQPRITIASIYFQGQTPLPQTVQTQLVRTFRRYTQPFHDSDAQILLTEFSEAGVKAALHDRGYFRASVEAEAKLLSADAHEKRYSFIIRVTAGPLYRLGSVNFMSAPDSDSALVFPSAQLRNLIPLAPGEVFNVSKIRHGLDAITRLYGSNGYIDATVEPDIHVDDHRPILDVVLKIDAQGQYRVGKVVVVSSDTNVKAFVNTNLKTGQVFNNEAIQRLLRRYKSELPADASERDISVIRNTAYKTLDITFDFWSCPTQ